MSEHVRLHVDHRLWLISPCSSERRTERRRRAPIDLPGAARLSARPSLRYSPRVKLTLNLYDRPKADTGRTPRLENGAHPLDTPAARREKNSMNESTGLKHCEECATGSCRISGVAAALLP